MVGFVSFHSLLGGLVFAGWSRSVSIWVWLHRKQLATEAWSPVSIDVMHLAFFQAEFTKLPGTGSPNSPAGNLRSATLSATAATTIGVHRHLGRVAVGQVPSSHEPATRQTFDPSLPSGSIDRDHELRFRSLCGSNCPTQSDEQE